MKAELLYHEKWMEADKIIEIKIWSVPVSSDKLQGYKYSFAYVKGSNRIVGYDNAEGKGDHRHYRDKEEPYEFKNISKLFEDFYHDVRRYWK